MTGTSSFSLCCGGVLALLWFHGTVAAEVLTATRVTTPPNPTAGAKDRAWAAPVPLTVELSGGRNFADGSTSVTLKAVYSADTIYILAQYRDPSDSARRLPFQKQADGTWRILRDPDDTGGDDNRYYEDKLVIFWNIDRSIKNFAVQGCMAACHVGEADKAFGNMHTNAAGERGDLWHLKRLRTAVLGQADDQHLDHTRYDKDKAPDAGRKNDPKTAGGYADIPLVDGKPQFMHKSAVAANKPGGTYYVRQADKVPFDDGKFKPSDEVASILVAPFEGDRADVAATMDWSDGLWTVVFARKLVTGSRHDVQFDDLGTSYAFGVAAFDNAQVRHAFHIGPLQLEFAK